MTRRMVDFQTMSVAAIREWLQEQIPNKKQVQMLLTDERKGVRKIIESWQKTQERAKAEQVRHEHMWSYERRAKKAGYRLIAGIDEAGRGPLAGPVVVGAVILPDEIDLPGLNDSKQVREEVREELFDRIQQQAIACGIGIADAAYIDQHNILQATFEAARRAIRQLTESYGEAPDYLLTDFLKIPQVVQPYEAIVKGDGNSYSIAAASILAKVARDRLMIDYAAQYPQYGFEKHKGYASAEHMAAIEQYGPCEIHRKSFAPLKQDPQLSLF